MPALGAGLPGRLWHHFCRKDREAGGTSSSGSGSKAQLLPTTRTEFASDLKMLFADKGLELQAMSEELPQDNGQKLTDRYAVRDPADPTRSWGGFNCTYQKSGQLLSLSVDGQLAALTDSTGWYILDCIVYLIDKKDDYQQVFDALDIPAITAGGDQDSTPKNGVRYLFMCLGTADWIFSITPSTAS